MILATAAFVSTDAIAKHLLQHYSLLEVVWVRYAAHFTIIIAVYRRRVTAFFATSRIGLQLMRSSLLIGATFLFFFALVWIPLATASAIMFTAPLFVTSLSATVLNERVGRHRWVGVGVGLIGALVITRPGSEDWSPAMLSALGAAGLYALYQISTRSLSRTDRPQTTLIYTSFVGAVMMSAIIPFSWQTPTTFHALLMAIMGILSVLGHYALIQAFASAPASIVAPFAYTNLIWATLFGFFFFEELPNIMTFVGAGIIVTSGIYLFRREQRHSY